MVPVVLACGIAAATALALDVPGKLKPAPPAEPAAPPPRPAPAAPPALQARIEALGRGYGDRVGIAVRDVGAGWVAAYDGDSLYPQQSVSKTWVTLAVLDAVDRGAAALDQPVEIRPEDLSLFNQPIRKRVVAQGVWRTTPDELMAIAITQSDNAANDALERVAGGPEAVRAMLARKGITDVHVSSGERLMQTEAAGLTWRPEFSFGRAFWEARERLPDGVRSQALFRYLLNPPDGASPKGITAALARLQRGELLSPASTARMLGIMSHTQTGASRLRAGLEPGWSLAHKTGTGQVMGQMATGFNDVGLLTAPDGHVYAVAVMIGRTDKPLAERQALMAEVTRAVEAAHR
jgi:beta-lactamase class A